MYVQFSKISGEDGIPVSNVGPLTEWWLYGFDADEKLILGFSTDFAHYYITEPSPNYHEMFFKVMERAHLSKIVVQALAQAQAENNQLEYEDLLATIEKTDYPDFQLNNETLINNASFVYNSVINYERAGDDDEEKFMEDMPCIQHLLSLTNASVAKKKTVKIRTKKEASKPKLCQSLATTTPLTRDLFKEIFGVS